MLPGPLLGEDLDDSEAILVFEAHAARPERPGVA
jgi:hypothetical protein